MALRQDGFSALGLDLKGKVRNWQVIYPLLCLLLPLSFHLLLPESNSEQHFIKQTSHKITFHLQVQVLQDNVSVAPTVNSCTRGGLHLKNRGNNADRVALLITVSLQYNVCHNKTCFISNKMSADAVKTLKYLLRLFKKNQNSGFFLRKSDRIVLSCLSSITTLNT